MSVTVPVVRPAPAPRPVPTPIPTPKPQPAPQPAPLRPAAVVVTQQKAGPAGGAPPHRIIARYPRPKNAAGDYPTKATMRTGITELEVDLRTGRRKYGADLSPSVTNDPTVSPQESLALSGFQERRYKPKAFRLGLQTVRVFPETRRVVFERRREGTFR